jgi:hypothetical protein
MTAGDMLLILGLFCLLLLIGGIFANSWDAAERRRDARRRNRP